MRMQMRYAAVRCRLSMEWLISVVAEVKRITKDWICWEMMRSSFIVLTLSYSKQKGMDFG